MSEITKITQEDVDFFVEGYSSGYPYVDYISGIPGVFFPSGAVTELMGMKSTAKSTLVLEAIAQYHRIGGTKKTAYFDFESTIKKQVPYATAIGAKLTDEQLFEYFQPATMQDGGKELLKIFKKDKGGKSKQQNYAFVIVDTVAAMRPAQELENGFAETNQQGIRGKLMSELLRNLCADLDSDGPAVIFINQMYEEVNIKKGPMAAFLPKTFDSTASNALKFYAVTRYALTLSAKIETTVINPHTFEEDKAFIGSIIEVYAEKNKVGIPFRKARFFVRYGYGIDPVYTLITAGINKPADPKIILVEGKNAFFSYHLGNGKYSKRFGGIVNFHKFLTSDKEAALSIAKQISPEWEICIKALNKTEMQTVSEVIAIENSSNIKEPDSEVI